MYMSSAEVCFFSFVVIIVSTLSYLIFLGKKIARAHWSKLAKELDFEYVDIRSLKGEYKGYSIRTEPRSVKRKPDFVIAQLAPQKKLPYTLEVQPVKWFNKIRFELGVPELVFGVPEIDDQLIIRGAKYEDMKPVFLGLKDPQGFVDMCQEHQFNGIRESHLRTTLPTQPSADELRHALDRLAVLAADFDQAR